MNQTGEVKALIPENPKYVYSHMVWKIICVILQEFSKALFNLFDYDATEKIDQTEFIETLKINTR